MAERNSSKMPSLSTKISSGTEEPSTSSDLPSPSSKMPSSSTKTSSGAKDSSSSKMLSELSSEICCFRCKKRVRHSQRLHFSCCEVYTHDSCGNWKAFGLGFVGWEYPVCPKCGKLDKSKGRPCQLKK